MAGTRFRRAFSSGETGAAQRTPRHQTLYNLIEWSYQLLQPQERKLFARLAVFGDSWSLAAVQNICGDGPDTDAPDYHTQVTTFHAQESTFDLLANLVDKSLVVAMQIGDEVRYHLLETIHAFALDKLAISGEETYMRDRHLAYYLQFSQAWSSLRQGISHEAWQSVWLAELGNIRAALSWSLTTGAAKSGLQLALNTGRFWFRQGFHRESTNWFQRLLALPTAQEDKSLRLAALSTTGFTNWWILGDYVTAQAQQREALALAHELGDVTQIGKTLNNLGGAALRMGKNEEAIAYLEQSLTLFSHNENRIDRAWSLILLGEALLAETQSQAAQTRFAEAVQLLRASTNRSLLAYPIRRLGQIALLRQETDLAGGYLRESLELNLAVGEVEGRVACVAAYAVLFLQSGATSQATLLCAAVSAALAANRSQLSGYDAQQYAWLCGHLRSADASFAETWNEGLKMSLDSAGELIADWAQRMA
ncbi:MAG: tetratricopeptide repeat protein [Caldilineaceae bacterium]